MTDKPKISVCVVTYNQERYIKDCLLSVLTQAYDVALEVLVGDDGSTDGTPQIVRDIAEKHPGLVTLFRHERNLGPSANYQYLIERSTGNYIAHLDGDDYWMPGKLQAQAAFLEKHAECMAVYSNAVLMNEAKDILGAFNRQQPEVFDLDHLFEKGNFLNHSSLLYRQKAREVILDIQPPFIDYRIHLRLAALGKLGFVNQMLVAYRVGAEGSMIATANDAVRHAYNEAISEVIQQRLAGGSATRTLLFNLCKCVWSLAIKSGEIGKARMQANLLRILAPESFYFLVALALPAWLFDSGCRRLQQICKHLAGLRKFYVYTSR